MRSPGVEGEVGQEIKRCADFMIFIMKRTQELYADFERLVRMEAVWVPTGDTLSFPSYSSTLGMLDRRFPAAMGKLYAPLRGDELTREAIALEAHLSPTCETEQAILVLGHAQFRKPLTYAAAAAEYDAGEFVETLLAGRPPPFGQERRFEARLHPKVFPTAAAVRVMAWPMSEITLDSLRGTVVAAVNQLALGRR